jgi:hypothetical protein
LAFLLLGPLGTGLARANFITYQVNVDTSSLNGTSGYLDYQFNPGGNGAAPGSVTITNFSPVGNLNPNDPNNSVSGDVTGSLTGVPSPLTLNNDTAYNDYFESFTYGNSINFDVTLSGPAVGSSGAVGSSFAFSLYDSTGTIPLLTTDPNGSVLTINVNTDGSTSVETFPQSGTNGTPAGSAVSTTPEPSSAVLFVSALPAALVFWRRSRRRRLLCG